MTTTFIGELTIGDFVPGVFDALLAAEADLEARIAALANFAVTVDLDLSGQLALALQIVASIEAAIALGLTAPSISAQIAAQVALTTALQLQLELILELFDLFEAAGVWGYHYTGRADTLGSDMTTELSAGLPGGGGPSETVNALILITNVSATWTAMQQIFKTAP